MPASNETQHRQPAEEGEDAYPISTFTYAIVPHDAPQKGFLQQFINYEITKGQEYGAALDFAPLPKVVLKAARRQSLALGKQTAAGGAAAPSRRRALGPCAGLFLPRAARRRPGRRGGAGPR